MIYKSDTNGVLENLPFLSKNRVITVYPSHFATHAGRQAKSTIVFNLL